METAPALLTASQGIGVFIFLTTLTRAASRRHRYNLVVPAQPHRRSSRETSDGPPHELRIAPRLGRSRSGYGTWGQTGAGGSQQNRVEFYTLHLQRWRHWIWHTTPTPAGASTGCTRSSGILHFYTSFSDPSAQVSAPVGLEGTDKTKKKKKMLDALGADTLFTLLLCSRPLHTFCRIAYLH